MELCWDRCPTFEPKGSTFIFVNINVSLFIYPLAKLLWLKLQVQTSGSICLTQSKLLKCPNWSKTPVVFDTWELKGLENVGHCKQNLAYSNIVLNIG